MNHSDTSTSSQKGTLIGIALGPTIEPVYLNPFDLGSIYTIGQPGHGKTSRGDTSPAIKQKPRRLKKRNK